MFHDSSPLAILPNYSIAQNKYHHPIGGQTGTIETTLWLRVKHKPTCKFCDNGYAAIFTVSLQSLHGCFNGKSYTVIVSCLTVTVD
jgi:hypothetical protein